MTAPARSLLIMSQKSINININVIIILVTVIVRVVMNNGINTIIVITGILTLL